jgi:Ala-tRNA(Pro) deacylase
VLLDKANMIKVIIDETVAKGEWYGCSDGTATGYMKIKTTQVTHDFLPYTFHTPYIIRLY